MRRNIQSELDWNVTIHYLDNFSKRRQNSAYNEVIQADVEGHDNMATVKKGCGTPFNRLGMKTISSLPRSL